MTQYLNKIVLAFILSFSAPVFAGEFSFVEGALSFIAQVTKKAPTTTHQVLVKEVYTQSIRKGLDPTFVLGMVMQESTFNRNASSFAGAKGFMQVIPRYHREKIQGRNILDTRTNIDVGTSVLQEYLSTSRNLQQATRRYSGGANNYYQKVARHQSSIKRHIHQVKLTPAGTPMPEQVLPKVKSRIIQIKHTPNQSDPIKGLLAMKGIY